MEQVELQHNKVKEETKTFFQRVYAWMFAGLIISGITAYAVSINPSLYETILFNKLFFYSLLIGEFILVLGIASLIKKISADLATFLFILYCFTTGLTLSVIFLIFTTESIGMVFFLNG
jgi:FtsH-binding integral membrane protein